MPENERLLQSSVNATYSYYFVVYQCGSLQTVGTSVRRWRRQLAFETLYIPDPPASVPPGDSNIVIPVDSRFTTGHQYCTYIVVNGNDGAIAWRGQVQTFYYPSPGRPYGLNPVLVDNPPNTATFTGYATYDAGNGESLAGWDMEEE